MDFQRKTFLQFLKTSQGNLLSTLKKKQTILISYKDGFGSIVIILGWIGLFSPVSKGNIEGLLLGDLAWLWVLYIFIDNNVKTWTLCAFATGVALVVFLALTRIVYLISIRSSSKNE